jgi:ArsR family metal-binding transcriptional regulator
VVGTGELLAEIHITLLSECLADPTKVRVVAELSSEIGEILPYLAALLPYAGYNHAAGVLSFVHEGRLVTVYAHMVTVAKAEDEDDAAVILEWLRGQINEANARRHELVPCLARRRTPRPLDIYTLLPRDNCRRCGQPTCMAFASRLVFGEARPEDCPHLAEAGFEHNRSVLVEWLGQ